jgi:hypothetical protein
MRSHADALHEVIRPRESVVMTASSEVCASSHLISLIDPKHLSVRSLFALTFATATPFEKLIASALQRAGMCYYFLCPGFSKSIILNSNQSLPVVVGVPRNGRPISVFPAPNKEIPYEAWVKLRLFWVSPPTVLFIYSTL